MLGWTSWRNLPLDLLPDLQSPTIVVSIRSGDRPPAEMERIYGEQVEQRLFAVSGIREINQVARTGRIIATVVFEWDTDMDFALVDVEKAVGPIRSDPDVDEVLVRHFDPRQAEHHLRNLANTAPVFDLSAKSGEGIDVWLAWLRGEIAAQRERVAQGQTARPAVQPDGARLHGHTHTHDHDHGHDHDHHHPHDHEHP